MLKVQKTGAAKTLRNDAGFLDVYGRTTGVWTYRRTNAHDGPRLRPHQGRARVAGLPNKLPTLYSHRAETPGPYEKLRLDAIEQA